MVRSRVRNKVSVLTAVCGLAGLFALAGVPARAQNSFRQATSAAVSDGVIDGFIREQGEQNDTPGPQNVSLNGFNKTYANGATFTASSAGAYRGFYSSGTYAMGAVTNASYPTTAPEFLNLTNPFGYYVIGGVGSFMKHRFETPESLTGVYGTFHWTVDGNASATLGTANSRLDFAVTQGATSFSDLYNATITPNLMTQFGPGTYSYTTGIALGVSLDFLFWSSSYWQVTPSDLATLGSSHRDISGQALFMNTFNLASIDLYKSDGTLITNWNLIDEASGQTIFNQNGRVTALDATAAPEPSSLAFLAVAGMMVPVLRNRRKIR